MAKMTDEQKKKRDENKAKKLAEEAAKNKQAGLASELKKLRERDICAPRFTYQVGEKVKPRVAFWSHMIVKEILDDGKILLLEIYNEKEKNPILSFYTHLEVLPWNHPTESDFEIKLRREMRFSSRDIEGLIHMHYDFGIDFSPSYQRELCWTEADKIKLIDSIFKKIDIGSFAFIHLPYSPTGPAYEILDGKQRLTTLIEFFEDKFPYQGKYFSDLSFHDKKFFSRTRVSYGDTREDEEWTLADKMEYFLRLNVGGVPQSTEHLAKISQELATIKKNQT